MHGLFRIALAVLTITLVGCAGAPPMPKTAEGDADRIFEMMVARDLIFLHHHGVPVNEQGLHEAAMRGMIAGLDDPYAKYMTADERRLEDEKWSGEYAGIGATIDFEDELPVITDLTKGGPAAETGLLRGDAILSINGTPVSGMERSRILMMIRGRPGTAIEMTVQRGEACERYGVTIVRRTIRSEPVTYRRVRWRGTTVALIGVTTFNGVTAEEFDDAVDRAVADRAEAVILDLRGNLGGFVESARHIACTWIGDGVVSWQHRRGSIAGSERCRKEDAPLSRLPTAVLVNGSTASASEILSGALRDHGKAVLIGTKTYGKGIVQGTYELPFGGAVKLTIHEWRTPSGSAIHEKGIVPDITVEPEDGADDDAQLQRALSHLTH